MKVPQNPLYYIKGRFVHVNGSRCARVRNNRDCGGRNQTPMFCLPSGIRWWRSRAGGWRGMRHHSDVQSACVADASDSHPCLPGRPPMRGAGAIRHSHPRTMTRRAVPSHPAFLGALVSWWFTSCGGVERGGCPPARCRRSAGGSVPDEGNHGQGCPYHTGAAQAPTRRADASERHPCLPGRLPMRGAGVAGQGPFSATVRKPMARGRTAPPRPRPSPPGRAAPAPQTMGVWLLTPAPQTMGVWLLTCLRMHLR